MTLTPQERLAAASTEFDLAADEVVAASVAFSDYEDSKAADPDYDWYADPEYARLAALATAGRERFRVAHLNMYEAETATLTKEDD